MDFLAKEVTSDDITKTYIDKADEGFQTSVQQTVEDIDVQSLEDKIQAYDIDGATEEVNMDESRFSPLEIILMSVWLAGLTKTYQAMTATKVLRETLTATPRPDAPMQVAGADVVQKIIKDLGVEQQGAVRATILSGYSANKRPRDIALDLAGRYDNQLKRRVGGMLGLGNQQADLVAKIEQALTTGDKKVLRDYLKLKTRDARYDTWAKKVIGGDTLSPDQIGTMTSRLSDRLLHQRSKNIADNSVRGILAKSQDELVQNQIRAGTLDATLVTKGWHTMEDEKVRFSHEPLDGTVIPIGENFVSGRGVTLAFPHDPGAPVSETAGCRCWLEYSLGGTRLGRPGSRGF